jgi:uncharacterized protein (TIGR00730 family)
LPFVEAARELGEGIALRGWDLIFGGTDVGLMAAAARGAQSRGGRVVGIVPRHFMLRGIGYGDAHEIIECEDLRERKRIMSEQSDVFVALPGGLGTLDEIADTLANRNLRLHDKPLLLINTHGFFDGFVEWLRGVEKKGFIGRPLGEMLYIESSVGAALDSIARIIDDLDRIRES